MDFLNQAYAQLSDLFRSMTVGARITAALLLAVVVVSLGFLFNQRTAGPDQYLMGAEAIPASYMPSMEAAFAKAGLNDYQIDGARIRVPRGKSGAYMAALADANALPPTFSSYIDEQLGKGGIFEPQEVRTQRIKTGRQQQLAAIIEAMPDIQSAMVMYDETAPKGLRRQKIITASVNVQPIGNQPLDAGRVATLRNIVASAIAGLDAKKVSVTDLNSGRSFAASSGDEAIENANLYAERKKHYEREWSNKVENALSMIPDSVVAVTVELTPEMSNQTTEEQIDPKPVPLHTETTTVTSSNEAGSPGGRPGTAAQGPGVGGPARGAFTAASSNGTKSSSDKTIEVQHNIPARTLSVTRKSGLIPKQVKVSVGIPNSYVRRILQIKNPNQEVTAQLLDNEQTIKRTEIKSMVSHLVPNDSERAEDAQQHVTVTFFEDVTEKPTIVEPSSVASAMGWFSKNLSTVSISMLAVFGMVMLRSIVRSSPSTPSSPSGTANVEDAGTSDYASEILPFAPEPGATEEERVEHEKKLKRRLSSGPSVKDELAELVKEDPDAAATILRTWISNAG